MTLSFDNRDGWIWFNGSFVLGVKQLVTSLLRAYIMLVVYLKVKEPIMVKFLNLQNTQIVYLILLEF